MYDTGRRVPQNDEDAAKWYRKAESKSMLKRNAALAACMIVAKACIRATMKQPSGTERQQSKDMLVRNTT